MSNTTANHHQVVSFPKARNLLVDNCELGRRKHLIHALLEVDVTEARRRLKEHARRNGETISFTGFLIHCVGQAVDADKTVHAYRARRNRMVLFDEVDVTTIIEVEKDGRKIPLGRVIRNVNNRSLREIHAEIRQVQKGSAEGETRLSDRLSQKIYLSLPAYLRRSLFQFRIRKPEDMKKSVGTVLVTAVGMFGKGAGWGIPLTIHTLTVTLGGIAEKPGVIEGKIEPREFLNVTISFDHDIVDGAPAARFSQRLKDLVEGCFGIDL